MNRLFLVLLIFPLMFISCEEEVDNQNNDDQNNNNSVSILGTWRVLSETTTFETGYIDPVSGNLVITDSDTEVDDFPVWDPDCESIQDYYEFTNNTIYLIYTCNGNTDDVESGDYTLTGNNIYNEFFGDGDTTWVITDLSDNYLTFSRSLMYEYTENDSTFIDRVYSHTNLVRSDFTYILEDQNSYNNKSVRRNRSFVNRKMNDR